MATVLVERGHTQISNAAALLAAIVESSDDAILSKNLQGIIQSWNKGAQKLFGYQADEVIGKPVTILIPEDRQDEEVGILKRLRAGERVEHFETVRRRKDGTLLDISLTISPVHNDEGQVIGASKIARDIGDRKRFEERQALLLREMHHRVKNLFALTGALVSLSARSATTAEDFANSIRERLMALSKAHELTLPRQISSGELMHSTTLASLVLSLIVPYQDGATERFKFTGEDIAIDSRHLTNVALLFHEFVTNSAKYGALSVPDGQILIEVSTADDVISIKWQEVGGPPVEPSPDKLGFGSQLEESIKLSLNATIAREWIVSGLAILITVPVGAMSDTMPV